MPFLPRRYLLVATFLFFGLVLIIYSSPSARDRASSLSTKYNAPWVSSPQQPPTQPDIKGESEPIVVPPDVNKPSSNLFPGSPSSLLQDTAITESRIPLQEAGVTHASGFTYFERLYVWNGTIYAVMDEERQKLVPDLGNIISKGKNRGTGENLDPTDAVCPGGSSCESYSFIFKEMQVITPEEAKRILGTRATVIEGTSFICYDTRQYMAVSANLTFKALADMFISKHYYHWWGEILLGAMRVYSSLALLPSSVYPTPPESAPYLPDPDRFILPVS